MATVQAFDLTLKTECRTLWHDDHVVVDGVKSRLIGFSRQQMAVIEPLMKRAGRMVAIETIMGLMFDQDERERANELGQMRIIIWQVRKRMAVFAPWIEIANIHGTGYILRERAALRERVSVPA